MSIKEADQHLRKAGKLYTAILADAEKIRQAHAVLDEALGLLPLFPLYLEVFPGEWAKWQSTAKAAEELADLLGSPLPAPEKAIANLHRQSLILAGRLDELNRRFLSANLNHLEERSREPQANPGVVREIEAILAVPHPLVKAGDRARLWQAGRDLARRLHEQTVQIDQAEENHQAVAEAPVHAAAAAESPIDRSVRRARISLALFQLAGMNPSRWQPLRERLNQGTRTNADRKLWYALANDLRHSWCRGFAGTSKDFPGSFALVRWSWIAPPLDSQPVVDGVDIHPVRLLHQRRTRALASWLSGQYRYVSLDYKGVGLTTPPALAAREFYAFAADTLKERTAIEVVPKVALHTKLAPGWLSPRHPATRAVVQILGAGPIRVKVINPDANWLELTPEPVAVPAVLDSPVATSAIFPLRIQLRPEAWDLRMKRPRGVLLEARAGNHHFHFLVPVPVQDPGPDFQVFLSGHPGKPTPVEKIRLRPGQGPQNFRLHAVNPTGLPCPILIRSWAGDPPKSDEILSATLKPKETKCLPWQHLPGMDQEPFPGPIHLELLDARNPQVVLDARSIPVEIMEPDQPATLRLDMPATIKPQSGVTVPVQVRNVPRGAPLEIALGQKKSGEFIADLVRVFPADSQRKLTARLDQGHLVFEVAVKDRDNPTLDLSSFKGLRTLRGRLRDGKGKMLAQVMRDVTFQAPSPPPPTTGTLRGLVAEGPLVQPGLIVILRDEMGKEKARATTGPQGGYQFDKLPPGRYTLYCFKPTSRRQATSTVITIQAGQTVQINLSLKL